MFRFIIITAALCIGFRVLFGRWPWEYLRSPASGARAYSEADIYKARLFLGVSDTASSDEIQSAFKRRVARDHPDHGGSGEDIHKAQAARDLLLDVLANPGRDKR